MELLCAIAGKASEFTIGLIGRQFGYLIFYHSNVKSLRDEFKELQDERVAVQHWVDDEQRNGKEIEEKVQNWFIRVDEIIKLVEKLCEEESHANTGCSCWSCPNLWLRRQLSRKAKKMTQEVVEIKKKGKFEKVSFFKPSQWLDQPSFLSKANEGMESRISTMNKILEALADPNVNMIGLCGLPGVGKTHLVKEVAKKVKEENLFETVVWVVVAQNPHLKEVQREIADMVGMKFEVESEIIRAGLLYKRLKQEKVLVILDDLWERLDLSQVGIPLDDDGRKNNSLFDANNKNTKCCKILLTSRREELLCSQMKCKRNIKVGVLSKSESWELFKEMAELHDNSDNQVFLEVAQRCGGLPLAIVAVATALKNKSLVEWRDALSRLPSFTEKHHRNKRSGFIHKVELRQSK